MASYVPSPETREQERDSRVRLFFLQLLMIPLAELVRLWRNEKACQGVALAKTGRRFI